MGKRLEITIFGTFYRIAVMRITRALAKAGMNTYGTSDWNHIVSDIALGTGRSNLLSEVRHTLGHDMSVDYRIDGLLMQDHAFGLEIFHGGLPNDVDVVDAESRTLMPERMVENVKHGDLLGVFWGRCDGVLFFRWDEADEVRGEDLTLCYDRIPRLIDRKTPFDLATNVTWKGQCGRRRLGSGIPEDLHLLKPVFHMFD
ncbi:hypothetical protein [Pseudodesulfovibrio sp.]|uniref:hypothetical protein n=1 Tax=unclassified Pseudodesulfovibrio TaxID=2661612 RepID=UPI003AFF68EE